jgi:hypothetical protein
MRKAVPRDGFFYTLSVMKKKTKAVDKKVVPFLSAGMMIGLLIGSLTDNLGLWLSLGIALGASVGYAQVEKK